MELLLGCSEVLGVRVLFLYFPTVFLGLKRVEIFRSAVEEQSEIFFQFKNQSTACYKHLYRTTNHHIWNVKWTLFWMSRKKSSNLTPSRLNECLASWLKTILNYHSKSPIHHNNVPRSSVFCNHKFTEKKIRVKINFKNSKLPVYVVAFRLHVQ